MANVVAALRGATRVKFRATSLVYTNFTFKTEELEQIRGKTLRMKKH